MANLKAKIWCECTCCQCGRMIEGSTYYRNTRTISKIKESAKDWVWSGRLYGNVCPECQKEMKGRGISL